jgi:antitoxin StbD
VNKVLTKQATSISKFKANPNQSIRQAGGEAFAVLTNNEAAFYVLPPAIFEELLELLWEKENQEELLTRSKEKSKAIRVSLQDT